MGDEGDVELWKKSKDADGSYANERYVKDLDMDKLNADLYYILVEKTTGESINKVKSVKEGCGLLAYFKIYWWFVKTSGIAIQDRSRKTMYPGQIVKEEKMAEAIEEWEMMSTS